MINFLQFQIWSLEWIKWWQRCLKKKTHNWYYWTKWFRVWYHRHRRVKGRVEYQRSTRIFKSANCGKIEICTLLYFVGGRNKPQESLKVCDSKWLNIVRKVSRQKVFHYWSHYRSWNLPMEEYPGREPDFTEYCKDTSHLESGFIPAQFSKVPLKRVSNFFKIGNQKNFALTPLIIIFYCIFKLQFSPNTKFFF